MNTVILPHRIKQNEIPRYLRIFRRLRDHAAQLVCEKERNAYTTLVSILELQENVDFYTDQELVEIALRQFNVESHWDGSANLPAIVTTAHNLKFDGGELKYITELPDPRFKTENR